MDRRGFVGVAGGAAVGCLVSGPAALGADRVDLSEFQWGYPWDSDFKPWWTMSRSIWKGCNILWYQWPQDRYIVFESEPLTDTGEIEHFTCPTFNLADIVDSSCDRYGSLWDAREKAIRAHDNCRYCCVVRITGLAGEYGIITCRRRIRPCLNPHQLNAENRRRRKSIKDGLDWKVSPEKIFGTDISCTTRRAAFQERRWVHNG